MWFTRVSIGNPVLATMVMLAFVVLGLFSYQRLAVDQFPNIDFPTVVVVMDYPGASPEIVESEVTKKIEEAVNTVAGINTPLLALLRGHLGRHRRVQPRRRRPQGRRRRAREGLADPAAAARRGQGAADLALRSAERADLQRRRAVRGRQARGERRAAPKRARLGAPSGAAAAGGRRPASRTQELTTWATQVLQKRLENVRGVGSVSVVGGLARQINIYLKPAAMEALGIGADQVVAAVRSENQELPLGSIRSKEQERVVQINARLKRPEDFRDIVVARKSFAGAGSTGMVAGGSGSTAAPVRLWQVADIVDGPQEVQSLALYNGQRTVLLSVQKSQGENTIEVVDGLYKALADAKPVMPPGVKVEVNRDNSRSIRVSVANVKRTLFEGAALTILIVFLFLNSWRSTVITGLTLPIALIGTFLFMYMFGFTINTITMMALSLCVGLLIDDAIVVRENIVRHVQMGKSAHEAALAGTQRDRPGGAGDHALDRRRVPADRLHGRHRRQVLPRVRPDDRRRGADLDVRQLHPRPDAVERLARPAGRARPRRVRRRRPAHALRPHHRPGHRRVRPADAAPLGLATSRPSPGRSGTGSPPLGIAVGTFVASFFIIPILGAEFVPKADFSETQVNYYTPVGSSLEVTEMRARQVDAVLREMPEVRYTVTTINSGQAAGKIYAATYVRLVDRKDRKRSVAEMAVPLRERLARIPGITVTNIGQTDLGGGKSLQFSIQGTDLGELERLSKTITAKLRQIPGLVDLDTTLKPDKPTVAIEVRRDAASDAGLNVNMLANTLRTLVAGTDGRQLARARRRELRRQRAPRAGEPLRHRRPAAHADQRRPRRPTARRASCGCRRWPT